MSATINLDSIEAYELYEKAIERTRELLESESRRRHRLDWWRGEMDLCSDDIERIKGAALALEAMFGVHDYSIVIELGIDEARGRFGKACDREIAIAKRRRA